MSYTAATISPKVIQPIEAKPNEWKKYLDQARHLGTIMKYVGGAMIVGGALAGVAPAILAGVIGYSFGSFGKAHFNTVAQDRANEAAAFGTDSTAKRASFLKNLTKNVINPLA